MHPPEVASRGVPHVVWVTNEASVDPRAGGGLRSQRLITALAVNAKVDVVALGQYLDPAAYAERTGVGSVACFPPQRRSRAATTVTALKKRVPLAAARWHSAAAAERVRDLVLPDSVVVLEHCVLLPYRPDHARYVLSLQNIDSLRIPQMSNASWIEQRWSAATFRRIERLASCSTDALVVTVSDTDAGLLPGPSVIVPNGTDLPTTGLALPHGGTVLFIGSMGYPPNAQAVRWWAKEIWPLTLRRVPLTVVGSRASEILVDIGSHPAVTLIGEVPDVTPYLRDASIVVIPLLAGSGTRLKLLEALGWGRAVVTTSKGAEGIPVVDGRSVLIAETAEEFAAAVDRLLANKELAADLGRSGRKLAEDFAWPRVTPLFVEAVSRFAAGIG